ncbi:MAG: hypothetical protein QG597_2298 [Actinomycetota bacterium]|nr:hypothetical protein [Actinomycetota bacterium]
MSDGIQETQANTLNPDNENTATESPNSPQSPNPATVIMYLRELDSPTPEAIPARPAMSCSHLETVCSLCVRWWNLDWNIDFNATAAGRELLAVRRSLDAR